MENHKGLTGSWTGKIKLFSGPGTRRWPRFDVSDVPSIGGVSSDAGFKIRIANISRGGALLQTGGCLAPRARVHLHFSTAQGIVRLTAKVLRSGVAYRKGTPRHQAAVVFNSPLRILDALPGPAAEISPVALLQSTPFDLFLCGLGKLGDETVQSVDSSTIAAFLAAGGYSAQDASLDAASRLNNWWAS